MAVFLKYYLSIIFLSFFLDINSSNAAPNQLYTPKDVNVKGKFGKLLNDIAQLNEKRLEALKHYNELDSYKPSDGLLRQVKKKKKETITVLNQEVTKDIVRDSLRQVVCRNDATVKLSKYNELMTKVEKETKKDIFLMDDDNTRAVINEILREMICKKKRNKKIPVTVSRTGLDHKSEEKPVARYYDSAERKLRVLKQYLKSKKFQPGNAIFYEFVDDVHGEHMDDVLLVNDWHTQNVIHTVLAEMICQGATSPELTNYRRNRILTQKNKGLIREVLRDIICTKKIQRRKLSDAKNFDEFDTILPKINVRSRYSSESDVSDISSDESDFYSDESDIYRDESDKSYSDDSEYDNDRRNSLLDHHRDDRLHGDKYHNEVLHNDKLHDTVLHDDKLHEEILHDRKYHDAVLHDKALFSDPIHGDVFNSDPFHSSTFFGDNRKVSKVNQVHKEDVLKNDDVENVIDGKIVNNSMETGGIEGYVRLLRSSCWRDAKRVCYKSCTLSLRDVCDEYNCSRYMKKAFRKKCKRHCKDYSH